ncbi:acetyl-CoA carboxylase biotin carboxyl carrier protein subunit [Bacteroidia bacterium]|nr:acetyl-CoA carboxylase biotin carboxyl carrier protein subunit [Bacteroidia bacterium]
MKEYKMKINGNDYHVVVSTLEGNQATVAVNGVEYTAELEGVAVKPKTPQIVQQPAAMSTDYHPSTARTTPQEPPRGKGKETPVKSPLPGVILDVLVGVGDTVKRGQKLMVLEAMKMENNIDSDVEGVVRSIDKRKGDSVLEGDLLLTLG